MPGTTDLIHQGASAVRLEAGEIEATVIPSAGMIIASLRVRGDELLGRADTLEAWIDGGHTMGIPLLHPWANRLAGTRYAIHGDTVEIDPRSPLLHRDSNGLPIHGLLGPCRAWKEITRTSEAASARLEAVLDASDVPGLLDAFPFPHRLVLSIELHPHALTISTILVPTGDVAVPVAFGWHPYLRLPRAPRPEWELELPPMEMLELDALQLPTGGQHLFEGRAGPLGGETFDDGFGGLEPDAEMSLRGDEHGVTVTFDEGYAYGQVFAPSNQDVVALEPMTAPANALVSGSGLTFAEPGTPYVARFSVHVR
jgi:aldose 1-epimerase